jgi:hypothetical protein
VHQIIQLWRLGKALCVGFGSRLCENARTWRLNGIVFSLLFFRRRQTSVVLFLFNVFETNVLRESLTSEFSHSLGHSRHFNRASTSSGLLASSILSLLAELFPQAQNEERVDDQITKVPIKLVYIDQAMRDFVS